MPVKGQGILENVVLCATALEENEVGPGFDLLREFGERKESLLIGLTLRDLVAQDTDIGRVQSLLERYPAIQLLVPSNKFSSEYFDEMKKFQKPKTSWTVDTEDGLLHAMKGDLSAIISNHPIEMNEVLQSMKKRGGQCEQRLKSY